MSLTFLATGANQSWTVPAGVTEVTFNLHGAAGGRGYQNIAPQGEGGPGGLLVATIDVTPGEVLTLVIGKRGSVVSTSGSSYSGGGFGGGAHGGGLGGAGGGGATDVRRGGTSSLADRILVAGGGGGGAGGESNDAGGIGGAGGGTTGETGKVGNTGGTGGGGGTQTAGGIAGGSGTMLAGALGDGGRGSSNASHYGGGGGGGGYYGGGGGGNGSGTTRGHGGGGGSSWAFASARSVSHLQGANVQKDGFILISFLVPGLITGY